MKKTAKNVNKVNNVNKEYKRYYVSAINELMEDCNDLALLDLIKTLLFKSMYEPYERKDGATV